MYRLIIGDNNLIMSGLIYKNIKYDIIYLDPPYGMHKINDVIYKDNLNEKNWEQFMRTRLKKTKNLLKKDGILFISINDVNFFTLLRLCENIFKNYNIKKLKWKKFLYTKRKIPYVNPDYEFVLVVSKNELKLIENINDDLTFSYDKSLIHKLGISKYFSYPKPSELFFNLIKFYFNKKTLKILDAFAGSGSSIFGFEQAKINGLIENYEIDFIQKNEIMKNKYKNSIDTLKNTLDIFEKEFKNETGYFSKEFRRIYK